MFDHCPGSANLRTPTLSIKKCPECDRDVELFSNDTKVTCDNCGFVVYNDIASCVQWCEHARECLGEEEYNRLVKKKDERAADQERRSMITSIRRPDRPSKIHSLPSHPT